MATGLKTALTRTVNALGRKLKMLKDEQPNLSGDHIREGLGAIISVKVWPSGRLTATLFCQRAHKHQHARL